MPDKAIVEYGMGKRFREGTLERWLRLAEADREALFGLARGLQLGENHLRDFMDWLEEISLRDDVSFSEILGGESLAPIWANSRLGRNDKLRRIKEELQRLRFPRLARIEEEIQRRIRRLRLRPEIQLTFPPNLEGGVLTVQIRARSRGQLGRLAEEVGGLVERAEIREIFDLLTGKEEHGGATTAGSHC